LSFGRISRRVRAYVLSNSLPLLVGTLCWVWAETGCGDVNSWTALFHLMAYQAFHLATMAAVAMWFSHNRTRDTAPSAWRDLQSPYGLYLADVLSGWVLMRTHSHVPGLGGLTSLASFFLYRLLLMEIAFDFVHYCMHRLLHTVPVLYSRIHKIHHRDHANLHIGSTLQMHPLDGILTNTLPLLIAVALVPVHSRWELHAYAAYKTAQELFGHCGCHIKVKSFPSNPWLVQWLGIDLQAADHTLHHVDGRCNFGKRLNLWDRVFNTSSSRNRKSHSS